jgi:ATP-dependent RNA helicase HelY
MTDEKRRFRGSKRGRFRPKASSTRKAGTPKPRLDPALKPIFRKIGVPEPKPFQPDPYQIEALDLVENHDVLVSAPTGAGKTWIALQAIASHLARDRKVWYASPLKALSNFIYQEFSYTFGPERCGILTGDRKENPDAPVIVGTTEILRNQLYDAMHQGIRIGADLVILDEAHYLSDPDRGVVWEEVLIYLPQRVRLLLLSATLSNADEIGAWLEEIRKSPHRVVRSAERPVPLEMLFLFPEGLIAPLAGKRAMNPAVKRFLRPKGMDWKRGSKRMNFGSVIGILREFDLLPAIFFLKSRADCDRALHSCAPMEDVSHDREAMGREMGTFLKSYPHLEGHRQMTPLMKFRVAAHHGGQLPYWKVLVEKMMTKGYLEAIFSTSTVAAGVNFPARTVALVQSDRYNGREFVDLTATDLHQMIGRAGRRGMDRIGFALVIPGLHQDPQLLYDLRDSPPEPIRSQIHVNFSMVLNLLLSHSPDEVKALLEQSFAAFQEKRSGVSFQREWDMILSELEEAIPKGKCDATDPYEILENIQKRSELQKEIKRLAQAVRDKAKISAYSRVLKPGRLFLHKNGNGYVVFNTFMESGRLMCAAYNVRGKARVSKRRIRLKKVDMNQIRAIYDHRVDIPEDYSSEKIAGLLRTIPLEDLTTVHVDFSTDEIGSESLERVRGRLAALPCRECVHLKTCHMAGKGQLKKLLRQFQDLAVNMEAMGGGLWLSFKRHLRFLKETGFVNDQDRLTADGLWSSRLRLDQPLLIAEAIRRGALDAASPPFLAAGLAPFVWDRFQDVELKMRNGLDLTGLLSFFNGVLHSIERMRTLKARRGFDNPPLLFWPAAALFLWARGVPWEDLLSLVGVDEGDMASLIMRTADHLRQVTNLKDSHPALASRAEEAIGLILQEPVFLD